MTPELNTILRLRLETSIDGEIVRSEQAITGELLDTCKFGAPALLGMVYNDLKDAIAAKFAKQ